MWMLIWLFKINSIQIYQCVLMQKISTLNPFRNVFVSDINLKPFGLILFLYNFLTRFTEVHQQNFNHVLELDQPKLKVETPIICSYIL